MPLKVSDGMGAWVDDFKKSDAPQFKGKSDKERRDMAIAAYLSAKRGDKNEDTSDAVKAFLAKGGKIKKLPPAKAQGYHGKDDPGKDMHGMLDKPDTKKIGTRKKAKSMEGVEENYQVQKYTKGKKDGPAKSFGGDLKKATAHASKMGGDHRVHKEGYGGTSFSMKAMSKMKPQEKEKPPFDNPKPMQKDTKDKFGNPIKNRARHLARKAARNLLNNSKNESYLGHSDAEKLGKSRDSSHDNAASHIDYHLRRHPNASTASGGERDKLRHQVAKKLGYNVESTVKELSKAK